MLRHLFISPYLRSSRRSAQRIPFKPHSNYKRHITCSSKRCLVTDASRTLQGRLPRIEQSDRQLAVHWNSSTELPGSLYHYIWLRDHCRCPECFHPVTKQRLLNTFSLPRDLRPHTVELAQDGLTINWSNETPGTLHSSIYPWEWLKSNILDSKYTERSRKPTSTKKALWGSSIAKSPPTVEHSSVMQHDSEMYQWLLQIERFGFCFVKGVPPTPEATEELTRRIGFIRETQYGGFWDFSSDLAHGDTAYTNIALPAHTDTTYYTDPCGLQLFHLLQPAPTGGHTLLVDGFYIASQLRETSQRYFELLSTVKVPAHSAGDEESFYTTEEGKSVIGLDDAGNLKSIRWNNDDRSVMTEFGEGGVEEWYEALRVWNALLVDPKSQYWIPLKAGTVVVIDNHRVLHGRSEFQGPRRMCGAYVGVDEYRSRLRVLRDKYDNPQAGQSPRRQVWSAGL